MSRPIKLTEKLIDELAADFVDRVRQLKMFDGKIDFSKTYSWKDDEKVTIIFEPAAYTKMLRLIDAFSDEVAWHGLVKREGTKVFRITDILVYPQEVTGSTVNTDQEKYQTWLYTLPDEQFNAVRMQGHSHVNMSVTPSGVDITHQEKILEQLDDDMFYIFMIWNKRLEHTVKIFDLAYNTLYEKEDIIIQVGDVSGIDEFEAEAKELVVKKTFTPGYKTTVYTSSDKKSKATVYTSTNKTSKEEKKKENKKEENTEGVGSGWKGRGSKFLDIYDGYYNGEDYYDTGYYE